MYNLLKNIPTEKYYTSILEMLYLLIKIRLSIRDYTHDSEIGKFLHSEINAFISDADFVLNTIPEDTKEKVNYLVFEINRCISNIESRTYCETLKKELENYI